MVTTINYQPPTTPAGIKVGQKVPYLGTATNISVYVPPIGKPKSWTIYFVTERGENLRAVLNEGKKFLEIHLL